MALNGCLTVFGPQFSLVTSSGVTNFSLDQTTDKSEAIFQIPEDITVTRVGFRYGVRTGTPPTYKVSIQTVDATTGFPTGTVIGGGSPASATFTPPADATWDGTYRAVTLDNSASMTRGTLYGFVIEYSSGTVDGSNFSSFTNRSAIFNNLNFGLPYAIQNAAGTRTKQSSSGMPVFSVGSARPIYGLPVLAGTSTGNVNSNSTPDEIGIKFVVPSWGATLSVVGVRIMLNATAGRTFDMTLYDGTTALQAVTFDSDNFMTGAVVPSQFYFDETTLSSLTEGATYRLAFKPNETNTNLVMNYVSFGAAGDLAAFNGSGTYMYTSRTDAGAWSDTDTQILRMDLILGDVTGSSGGTTVVGQVFGG
jgi:hypothetical protein